MIATIGFLGLICAIVAAAVFGGGRQSRTSALAAAEGETIRLEKERRETDAQINADPDLLARARRVLHPADSPK